MLMGIESPTDRILGQLEKGFDTAKLRRAFETLRDYPFRAPGYFQIWERYGNRSRRCSILPVFAQELGLDSITYQKLRIEKYSPLRQLVEDTPGYYIGDDNIVYQERGNGRPYLKRISSQITREFLLHSGTSAENPPETHRHRRVQTGERRASRPESPGGAGQYCGP